MISRAICCAFLAIVCASAIAVEPSATPRPSVTASPDESPASTITQSVTDLSAQRATAERWRIYFAGRAYSEWLHQIAKNSSNAFLQRTVFERVNWMRLLASLAALASLSIFACAFIWIVHRRAGEI